MLRIEGAVSAGRRAMKDTDAGGRSPSRRATASWSSCPAANRDGSEFDHPDVVRVTREPNRHLSFGAGPHRCLGSHLARVEIRIALEELHRRIPDYRIDPDRPSVFNAGQVRGVVELPVLFTPETDEPRLTELCTDGITYWAGKPRTGRDRLRRHRPGRLRDAGPPGPTPPRTGTSPTRPAPG